MKKCVKCENQINDNANFCNYCWANQNDPLLKYSNTTRVTQQLSNEKNISSQIAVDYKEQITKDSSVAVLICDLASIFFCLLNYIAVPFMHLIGLGFGIFSVVKGAYAFKYKNVKAIYNRFYFRNNRYRISHSGDYNRRNCGNVWGYFERSAQKPRFNSLSNTLK